MGQTQREDILQFELNPVKLWELPRTLLRVRHQCESLVFEKHHSCTTWNRYSKEAGLASLLEINHGRINDLV